MKIKRKKKTHVLINCNKNAKECSMLVFKKMGHFMKPTNLKTKILLYIDKPQQQQQGKKINV